MIDEIREGTILIEEGTQVPDSMRFDSEPYCAHWRSINNIDVDGLDGQIRTAGRNFFYLAGHTTSLAFGSGKTKTIRKAIGRLIANEQSNGLNCRQIAQVTWKRFLSLPYVSVSARGRHIQKSMFLSKPEILQAFGRI